MAEPKVVKEIIALVELTQKLFTEAGYPGNVYKAEPKLLQRFEAQALEILKEE